MADDEYVEDGHDLVWKIVGLIIIILVVGTILTRHNLIGGTDSFFSNDDGSAEINSTSNIFDDDKNSDRNGEGLFSAFGSIFPVGDLGVGDKIMNKGEVIVRSEPAGQILGTQLKRASGKILEGPVSRFDKQWVRVDYKNAPDGWVWKGGLTGNVFWYTVFNIIPITLGLLRPFFIFLGIIALVLIILIIFKALDLRRTNKKKDQYVQEHEIRSKHAEHQEAVDSAADELDDDDSKISEIEIGNLPTGDDVPETSNVSNRRWSNIQSLINSHSVNDWKQAILEADVILDDMLTKMTYKGAGVGEKLKQVEKSDFVTLNNAWEAHKIRNRVAHADSNYVLSRDDAEKAIENYRKVFEEFYFI
jgi:hypothetical protein